MLLTSTFSDKNNCLCFKVKMLLIRFRVKKQKTDDNCVLKEDKINLPSKQLTYNKV